MRRKLIIAAGILVFLAAAYTAYWNVMASRAAGWIALWAAPAQGKSWHGSFASAKTSGFPFSLRVRIAQPVITWQGKTGKAVWQGPWLTASFRPWNLGRFDVALPAKQAIRIDDGTSQRTIVLAMTSGQAEVEVAGNRARALSGTFEDISAAFGQGLPPAAARRLSFHAEAAGTKASPVWSVTAEADDIRPAGWAPAPFDATIPHAEVRLRFNGELPAGSLADRLAAWRDAGGTIDVDALKLDWPPLQVDANGTVALDREMRPIGAFTAQLEGYRAVLDALAKAGEIEHSQAVVAGAALDAMATEGDNGTRRLKIPVSVQNGKLFAGPFVIASVPPVLPPGTTF